MMVCFYYRRVTHAFDCIHNEYPEANAASSHFNGQLGLLNDACGVNLCLAEKNPYEGHPEQWL